MKSRILGCLLLGLVSLNAQSTEVDDVYGGGDAKKGETFFTAKTVGNSFGSCTACHTTNLKGVGTHAVTKRDIKPLAPIANPDRLTTLSKTDKWFKRNCNDVIGRECSIIEKKDIVAFLRSIK